MVVWSGLKFMLDPVTVPTPLLMESVGAGVPLTDHVRVEKPPREMEDGESVKECMTGAAEEALDEDPEEEPELEEPEEDEEEDEEEEEEPDDDDAAAGSSAAMVSCESMAPGTVQLIVYVPTVPAGL